MENMPDMEQLGKIINAVKTAQMIGGLMQGQGNSNEENNTEENHTEESHVEDNNRAENIPCKVRENAGVQSFDMEFQSPAIRSIKAAIPYLDYRYQRNMGIIVKLMEMDRLINHYTVIAAENGRDNSREMLMAVKNELPEKSRSAADLLMKIMELKEIAENMRGVEV